MASGVQSYNILDSLEFFQTKGIHTLTKAEMILKNPFIVEEYFEKAEAEAKRRKVSALDLTSLESKTEETGNRKAATKTVNKQSFGLKKTTGNKKVRIQDHNLVMGETGSIGENNENSMLELDQDKQGQQIFAHVPAKNILTSYLSGNFGSRKSKDKSGYESKKSSTKVEANELEHSARDLLYSDGDALPQPESVADNEEDLEISKPRSIDSKQ